MIVYMLMNHHCLVGGKKLIDCLNRILKAGDKLCELCQRIITRHPDHALVEGAKHCIGFLLKQGSILMMQVGDKQRFAKRIHLLYGDGNERSTILHDEDIDTTWRHYRKNVSEWSKYPLACINCGKFEEKEGDYEKMCEEKEGVMRNAMTTRAPCGANKYDNHVHL